MDYADRKEQATQWHGKNSVACMEEKEGREDRRRRTGMGGAALTLPLRRGLEKHWKRTQKEKLTGLASASFLTRSPAFCGQRAGRGRKQTVAETGT